MSITVLAILLVVSIIAFTIGYLISSILIKKETTNLKTEIISLKTTCSNLQRNLEILKQENDNFYMENRSLIKENATLLERNNNTLLHRESLQKEFENISRKIIEDNRNQFSQQSSISLQTLINPVKEQLNDFKRKIEANHSKDLEDRSSLKTHIESIIKTNKELNKQAENLTQALKGNNKAQGNWGEMQLESILELAGMKENIDYEKQANLINENNKRQKPDFIIKLPSNKHIVIDAKVSLIAYEQYCSCESDEEKTIHLKSFINAIRSQIKDLSDKSYHSNNSLLTPEYTIMFLPIESAYILAIAQEPSLHSEAWNKGIVLVSTNNLFAILKTIANIIALEKRNKSSEEISMAAASMLDKFYSFAETFVKIGKNIDNTKHTYDQAIGQLKDGKGNLINLSTKLVELGVKSKKNKKLPSELDDNLETEILDTTNLIEHNAEEDNNKKLL